MDKHKPLDKSKIYNSHYNYHYIVHKGIMYNKYSLYPLTHYPYVYIVNKVDFYNKYMYYLYENLIDFEYINNDKDNYKIISSKMIPPKLKTHNEFDLDEIINFVNIGNACYAIAMFRMLFHMKHMKILALTYKESDNFFKYYLKINRNINMTEETDETVKAINNFFNKEMHYLHTFVTNKAVNNNEFKEFYNDTELISYYDPNNIKLFKIYETGSPSEAYIKILLKYNKFNNIYITKIYKHKIEFTMSALCYYNTNKSIEFRYNDNNIGDYYKLRHTHVNNFNDSEQIILRQKYIIILTIIKIIMLVIKMELKNLKNLILQI
jgi:hypothetical protein